MSECDLQLPTLIHRAQRYLSEAQTSADVLAARIAAKTAAHYAKLKNATAEAHADCLRIIKLAELRLADEIDAAQERGEIAKPSDTLRRGPVIEGSNNGAASLSEIGVKPWDLHMWRKLRDGGGVVVVERAIQAALSEGRAPGDADIRRALNGHHRTRYSGETEWYTPPEFVEAARACMGGIDLDPATSAAAQAIVRAARCYTIDDDGLRQEWHGRVWLNPPYAQPDIVHFIDKLLAELDAGRTVEAILLTHNYTDTGWFYAAAAQCAAICFTRGRIRFVNADGDIAASPTQGQAFFYFGPDKGRFVAAFGRFGFVMSREDGRNVGAYPLANEA